MDRHSSVSRKVFNLFNYSFMILFGILCVAPIWHVFAASVSDPQTLMATKGLLVWPVGQVTLEGYKIVLNNASILTGYTNTIIYVVSTVLLGTSLTLLGGYVLSRNDLKLKSFFTIFILFTLMFNGGLIPTYMVIKKLGLIGTRGAIIIPGVINAVFIIIMKSAFEQIPRSFEESAKIDGAGPLTILFRILIPLVKSTIAVVIMFTVVMQWNSWFPASIYLSTDRELWPLQLVMREILVQNDVQIISSVDATDKADYVKNLVKYSTTIVGTLPILLAYPFAQKYFVKGITLGGVKG